MTSDRMPKLSGYRVDYDFAHLVHLLLAHAGVNWQRYTLGSSQFTFRELTVLVAEIAINGLQVQWLRVADGTPDPGRLESLSDPVPVRNPDREQIEYMPTAGGFRGYRHTSA